MLMSESNRSKETQGQQVHSVCHLQQGTALLPNLLATQGLLFHRGVFLVGGGQCPVPALSWSKKEQSTPTESHLIFYKNNPQEEGS